MSHDPEALRRRLETNPTDEEAFVSLRAIYREAGYDSALADLLEYRATFGAHGLPAADLFFEAGELWLDRIGDPDRASAALLRAIDEHPNHRQAGDRLEALYRENDDMGALVELIERRIEALEAQDPGEATAKLRAHYHQQLGEIWERSFARQDQAVTHFRRAFELDPQNVMALYCARDVYQKAGNYETAAKLLDLEARAEPDGQRRIALYRELAHVRAERLGDIEGSVVALKRALALEPSSPDVMGELALLLLRRAPVGGGDDDRMRAAELLYQIAREGDGETAVGYCEASLDAWPDHEGALDLLEQNANALGHTELLLDRYRRLLESLGQSPSVWVVYRKLGNLTHQLGNFDEATSCYEALEPLGDPEDRAILENLYRATGRQDALAQLISKGLEARGPEGNQDPNVVARLRELAELLRSQGREDEAEERMRELLTLVADDPEATSFLERRYRGRGDWQALFGLLYGTGRNQTLAAATRVVRLREAAGIAEERLHDADGAIAALRLAIALVPEDEELRRQLDRILQANERWDELVERMESEAARARTPDDKMNQLRRIAEIHAVRRDDFDAAAETHRRILELHPNDEGALVALDEILLRQGRWEELIEVLSRRAETSAINAEKASLDLRIGSIFQEQLESPEEAYVACQRALAYVPDKGAALARMEAIDTILGNWDRLLETLHYKAEFTPKEELPPLLARAASLAADRLGDHEQATDLLRDLLDIEPENTAALFALSDSLEALGRWNDALDSLRRLSESATEPDTSLEVKRRVARIHEEKGDRRAAVRSWKEVLDQAEDAEALTALARHHEEEGDHDALIDVLTRLDRMVEDTPEVRRSVLLRSARVLAGPLERLDDAAAALTTLLREVSPEDREGLEALRGVHLSRGDFAAATATAEREIRIAEDRTTQTELLMMCAEWYRTELGDLPLAISANERVLGIDAYRSDVIAALEELYVETEDWERLLGLIRARFKAAADPELSRKLLMAGGEVCEKRLRDGNRAWSWYREIFDRLGDEPGTLEDVEAAAERLNLGPELVEIYGELTKRSANEHEQARWWKKIGTVYSEWIGDAPRALEAALRGYALDPNDQGVLDTIDDLSLRAKAHDRLVSVYDALLDREGDPKTQAALRQRLARVMLREGGAPGVAFDQLVEALELVPDSGELLRDVENAADASGRWEDLLDLYDTHREFAPSKGERIELLIRSARVIVGHLNAPDRAFELLKDAIHLEPEDNELASSVEGVIENLEDKAPGDRKGLLWRRLTTVYKELLRSGEDKAEIQVRYLERIADIEDARLGDGRAAFDTCRQATLIVHGLRGPLDMLERLAAQHRLWRELATHYGTALESVLDRQAAVDLHRRRARVLKEELGRPIDAIEHYWQLIQIDPTDEKIREALASLYGEYGRWSDLIMLRERELTVAKGPRRRELLLDVASTWKDRLDNHYEALDAYRKVLNEFPEDGAALLAIADLEGPTHGSLDDEALAALGLLDGAVAPPAAYSKVPDDYLTAGSGEPSAEHVVRGALASPPTIPEAAKRPSPLNDKTLESPALPDSTSEIEVDEVEEISDLDPEGSVLSASMRPDSTAEIDVADVEEVGDLTEAMSEELDLSDLDEAASEELDLEDIEEADSAALQVKPPPTPSKPPPPPPESTDGAKSMPPPLPKK